MELFSISHDDNGTKISILHQHVYNEEAIAKDALKIAVLHEQVRRLDVEIAEYDQKNKDLDKKIQNAQKRIAQKKMNLNQKMRE